VQAASAGVELSRGGDRGAYVRATADPHRGGRQPRRQRDRLLAARIQVGVGVRSTTASSRSRSPTGHRHRGGRQRAHLRAVLPRRRGPLPPHRRHRARLSIVKHATQRHGGEVRLWSRPGRGSTFTVRCRDPPLSDDLRARARNKDKSKKKRPRPRWSRGEESRYGELV
jgi:two-component system sensor histidine kinase SenX3